jgi:uncharacterized protein
MKRVLAAIWGSLAIVAAHAASFDCAQAESRAEKLICASPSLSALDEKLASAFGAARSAASKDQQQRLITAQRLWIKTARDHCADEACLATAYAARISHLVSAPALHAGEAPFVQANTLANSSIRTTTTTAIQEALSNSTLRMGTGPTWYLGRQTRH